MAQQMKNGSHYDGSTTFTVRDSARYAVVNPTLNGKHKKSQDIRSKLNRKAHWRERKTAIIVGAENYEK